MVGIRDEQGRILEKTGPLFQELSKNFPTGQYFSFADQLGCSYNNANALLTRFSNDYARSVHDVLSTWENAADGYASKSQLMEALKQANIGAFRPIVNQHFDKAQKREPSSDGDAKPPGHNEACSGDSTSTIQKETFLNITIGSGATVTGSINATGMSASHSAPRKRKRNATATDGVPSQPTKRKRKQKSSAKSNSAGAKGKGTNPNQPGSKKMKKKSEAKKAGKSPKAKKEGRKAVQSGSRKVKKVKSAAKKSAVKKSAAKKPAATKPTAKKPAAKKARGQKARGGQK